MRYLLITFIIVFSVSQLVSQENQNEIEVLRNDLKSIQLQIQQLEEQLKSSQLILSEETKALKNLDMQIILTGKQIKVYQTEIKRKNQGISKLKGEIELIQNKISQLEKIFKKQIVFAYKHQRGRQLDWLLGAKNLTNMIIRNQYFQIISKAEKNNYKKLTELQENLNNNENTLIAELSNINTLLLESNQAEKNLKIKRNSKESIISKVNNNNSLTQSLLQEKRESEKQLLSLIVNLEKGRSSRQLNTSTQYKWEKLTGDFAKNRGKLNWPVQGKVLHAFGRYRNPQLKTTLNNSGVDIQAMNGTEVRTIFSGVISLITYMSGFGNTIIIDHNDGYYSVYAHLGEILVNKDEFVEDGTIIGTVGESGSLEGPKLHFEIYLKNLPLNPVTWLQP